VIVAALLLATVLVIDEIARRAARGGVTFQIYGSVMPFALAIVLLGPLPAAAIAFVASVVDDLAYRRLDRLAWYATVYVVVALALGFPAERWIVPLDGVSFAAGAALVTIAFDVLGSTLIILAHERELRRRSFRAYARILPWIGAASIVVAAAADGYRTGGLPVLGLFMLALLACQLLLVRLDAVEVRLRAERDRSATYVQMVGTMVVSLDTGGRIAFMNERARGLLGEVTGARWIDVETGERVLEWTPTRLPDGTTLLSGEDVTERHEEEERIARLAFLDALTGLENRAVLDRELPVVLHHSAGAAFLLLDIDGFKRINDDYGHAMGDHVLSEVAARLRAVAAPEELLVRRGGDEFVLLAPDLHAADECAARRAAAAIAERLARAFEAPFPVVGRIDVSIATALYPFDGTELEQVANAALHGIKQRALL
jgi:diguanylate cyclase (GGDEF)-like protein